MKKKLVEFRKTASGSGMSMRSAALLVAVSACVVVPPVAAADFSFSGFGTLGYAQSNQSFAYQRFIDDRGTFWRDSVAGVQADSRFADKFGATLQIKAAPASDNDDRYEGTVSWAFLSWRPNNDWFFRVGKQRTPLYLYSETVDVGVTYDFARLPTEMYSIISNNDFTGISFNKNWTIKDGDLSLDGYWGKSNADFRFWIRDDIPAVQQSSGAKFLKEDINGEGLVLSYEQSEDIYRVGIHRAVGKLRNGVPLPTNFPFVGANGIGYYQVDNSLPGPGIPTSDTITATVITLGAKIGLGSGFRMVGEFARSFVPDTDISVASSRGYISLLKRIDKWTPYVWYAFLRSASGPRNLYNKVNYNTVPDSVPNAGLINASQRTGADGLIAWDQDSWAVGTSYSISATSKIKAEYMRTHIGQMSSLVDAPPGSNIRNQNINVFSLSYNFVF